MAVYSNDEIISLLKEGKEDVFKLIFQQYYRPLTLFALKYVGDIEEAKEITQEFFVKFWLKRAELNIQFHLKNYLYRGVRNACLNHIQASKVAQYRFKDYQRETFTETDALQAMVAAEQEDILMQAIDDLPKKCREIFRMSRMEKLSNQAIANHLQISIKTVETQISIALKRLRNCIIFLLFFFLLFQVNLL